MISKVLFDSDPKRHRLVGRGFNSEFTGVRFVKYFDCN